MNDSSVLVSWYQSLGRRGVWSVRCTLDEGLVGVPQLLLPRIPPVEHH
jgi:hypothetical protein